MNVIASLTLYVNIDTIDVLLLRNGRSPISNMVVAVDDFVRIPKTEFEERGAGLAVNELFACIALRSTKPSPIDGGRMSPSEAKEFWRRHRCIGVSLLEDRKTILMCPTRILDDCGNGVGDPEDFVTLEIPVEQHLFIEQFEIALSRCRNPR